MPDYSFDTLTVTAPDEAGILVVAITRPAAKNALDTATVKAIGDCIERAMADDAVRAIVITGEGKTFGIGADIAEIRASGTGEALTAMLDQGHAVFSKIENCQKPICAAINGVFCVGGSLELALACHFRVASKKTRLGLPEVSLGLIPGYGGTQRLARLVGKGRALEMILTGEPVRADDAEKIGLIHRECEDDVVDEAKKLLGKVLKNGPLAVAAAIRAITDGLSGTLAEGLALERKLFADVRATPDAEARLAQK